MPIAMMSHICGNVLTQRQDYQNWKCALNNYSLHRNLSHLSSTVNFILLFRDNFSPHWSLTQACQSGNYSLTSENFDGCRWKLKLQRLTCQEGWKHLHNICILGHILNDNKGKRILVNSFPFIDLHFSKSRFY